MDVENTYWVRNKLESDAGEAVDVTEMVLLPEDVEPAFLQPARKTTVRNKMTKRLAVTDFTLAFTYLLTI
jgi:hypothetical protein